MMNFLVSVVLALTAEVGGSITRLPDGEIYDVPDEYATVRDQGPKAWKKKLLKHPDKLWSGAAVIYIMDHSVGCPWSHECSVALSAMRDYETKTCVRFKQRSGETDFVRIVSTTREELGGTGSSLVGRRPGGQKLFIALWQKCTLLHELSHVLGLIHEFCRPDRDLYLEILHENIKPDAVHNFAKPDPKDYNFLGEPFDFDSITMYSKTTFSKNGLPTIKSKEGRSMEYYPEVLSAGDIRRIQALYRCDGAAQKARFPHDVHCPFDSNDCGFRFRRDGLSTWLWVPLDKEDKKVPTGGYVVSVMEQKDGIIRTGYIFSVNFFGLSTLDKKRGPEGCIDFCYKTKTIGKKPPSLQVIYAAFEERYSVNSEEGNCKLTLKGLRVILMDDFSFNVPELMTQLFKADRNTTLDFNLDTERSYQIWSSPKKFNEKFNMVWRPVSIRVDVSEPFMLIFKSSFADKTLKDWVMVDNLSVRYTSCENRKAVKGFDPTKNMSRLRRLTRPASKPFTPGSPRSSSCCPSLGSFSRSSSILSPSASSIGSSSRKWISGLLSKGSSSISPASDSSIGLTPRRRIAGLLSRRSSSSSTSRSSLGSSFRGQISGFFSRKSSSKSSTSESSTQKPISG